MEVYVGWRSELMAQRRWKCAAKQTPPGRFSASDGIIPYSNAPGFAYLQNKIVFGASK